MRLQLVSAHDGTIPFQLLQSRRTRKKRQDRLRQVSHRARIHYSLGRVSAIGPCSYNRRGCICRTLAALVFYVGAQEVRPPFLRYMW